MTEKSELQLKICKAAFFVLWFGDFLGIGKSKKIAKRNGANAMLTLLKQGGVTPGTAEDGPDGDYEQGVPIVSYYL